MLPPLRHRHTTMFLPRVLAARDIVGAALSPEAEPVLVARVNSLIPQTTAVMVANVLINLAISSTSMALLTYRCTLVKSWSRLPLAMWFVFMVFSSSWMFAFVTAVFQYIIKFNSSPTACRSTTQACIVFFLFTKALISLFLVERAHVVLGHGLKRRQSLLCIVNYILVTLVYIVCFTLYWPFHHAWIEQPQNICMLRIKRSVLLSYIGCDGLFNVYLTTLFLLPLIKSHSLRNSSVSNGTSKPLNAKLRELSLRTFIGSCLALITISANMIIFTVFEDEAMWLCMVCCQTDVLCTCLIVNWITPGDRSTVNEDEHLASMSSGGTAVGSPETPSQRQSKISERGNTGP